MDEYGRKQEFNPTIVDPFAFGDEDIKENRKEIKNSYPDPRLRLENQIELETGVG